MNSFKGLIPKNLLSDDAFNPLNKKVEEHRKITQTSMQFFQMVERIFDCQAIQYEKALQGLQIGKGQCPGYYIELVDCYEQICNENKTFSQKIRGSFKEMNTLCGVLFSDYANSILSFTQLVRSYQTNEQILFQMGKKYSRSLKTVMGSIEAYKASFSDVKLIYNNEERARRYATCKADYDSICTDNSYIQDKVDKVNDMKDSIVKAYEGLGAELAQMFQSTGARKISEAKNFTNFYCTMQKAIITMLAEKKIILDKLRLAPIISNTDLAVNPQHFTCEIRQKGESPPLLLYHASLKEEYAGIYFRALMDYPKQLSAKMIKRKFVNKRIYQFSASVIKILEKGYIPNLKEALSFFEKNKKRVAEIFGGRLVSFVKSMFSLLEISLGINEKLLKTIAPKVNSIQQLLVDDSKTFDLLRQELQNALDKMCGGKIRKLRSIQTEFTQQDNGNENSRLKKQISDKAAFLQHFLQVMNSKFSQTYTRIKAIYNEIINDVFLSDNQIYSLSCQYRAMYFGNDQFQTNFTKYQADLAKTVEKEQEFFKSINFGVLITEQTKITFNGDCQKFQQFKKLKKPFKEKQDMAQSTLQSRSSIGANGSLGVGSVDSPRVEKKQSSPHENEGNSSNLNEGPVEVKQGNKHLQFLATKVKLLKDEEIVKTFACALSDKIILQGRIFITTERICFHSKFNSSNLFFGGTFLQVPKQDIKKIEKRTNAIFFDNSISITTINGEIFFTSFFSRDEAYQLICRTFDINDDHALEEQDEKPIMAEEESVGPMQDDITNDELAKRIPDLEKTLNNQLKWRESSKGDVEFEGLNALKVLKIFYSGQEITFNRKNYPSFIHYYKQIACEAKDIEIEVWQPNIFDFLNPNNIKKGTPYEFKRTFRSSIPIRNPGIPFMPKYGKAEEKLTLKIFSKDKFVLESLIKSSGAPYTDCFQIFTRTTVQTKSENMCHWDTQLFVQFLSRPMVAGIIETRTYGDTCQFNKMWLEAMKKYFKNLNKLKSKSKVLGQDNKDVGDAEKEELENQLSEAKQETKVIATQLSQLKASSGLERKILIGSVVFNVLLLLLWLS